MPRPSRESVMTALFSKLVSSVQTSFTADTKAGDAVLYNPSTTAGLFVGLPVFGRGIPKFATILSTSPLTLSAPVTVNGAAVSMTTGFQTTSRRLKFWQNVSAQPAIFVRDGEEELEYANIILQRQLIKAEVWIYSNFGQDPDVPPIVGLNNLLDAVQAAFQADNPMTGKFTIGGLVEWCRMSGKITKDPGDLDGQAIAMAEVEIFVP